MWGQKTAPWPQILRDLTNFCQAARTVHCFFPTVPLVALVHEMAVFGLTSVLAASWTNFMYDGVGNLMAWVIEFVDDLDGLLEFPVCFAVCFAIVLREIFS